MCCYIKTVLAGIFINVKSSIYTVGIQAYEVCELDLNVFIDYIKDFHEILCFFLSKRDCIPHKLQDGNGREKRSALELLDRPDKNIIPYGVFLIVGIAE
ncbi:hypothetical protein V6N11_043431 [Hibiscus sabdariffa]|uniref:Uncharacterized protein n=1 Tax=Hibiscus sabdariffa TaxID=183260 RepID=A0ABR2RCI2_9ROSI